MPAWPFDLISFPANRRPGGDMQQGKVQFLTKFLGNFWRNDRRNLQCFPYCPKFGDYKRHKQFSSENGTCPSTYCHQPVEILVFGDDSAPLKVYGRFREVPRGGGNGKKGEEAVSKKIQAESKKAGKPRHNKTLHESNCPIYEEGQVLDSEECKTLAEYYDYTASRVAQNNTYWTMFRFNPNHWKYITKLPKTRAAIVNTEYCFEVVVTRMERQSGVVKTEEESLSNSTSVPYRMTVLHIARSTSFRIANTRSLLRTKSKEDPRVYTQFEPSFNPLEGPMLGAMTMSAASGQYPTPTPPPQLNSVPAQALYYASPGTPLNHTMPRGIHSRTTEFSPHAGGLLSAYGMPYTSGNNDRNNGDKSRLPRRDPAECDVRRVKPRLMSNPGPHAILPAPSTLYPPGLHQFPSRPLQDQALKHMSPVQTNFATNLSLANPSGSIQPNIQPNPVMGFPHLAQTNFYHVLPPIPSRPTPLSKPLPFDDMQVHQNSPSSGMPNVSLQTDSVHRDSPCVKDAQKRDRAKKSSQDFTSS